jgi:hypothetical protein
MNTQSANQNNPHENIDLRMRTLRTLWIALFLSVGLYFLLTIFKGRSDNVTPNETLSLILIAAALSTTLISFLLKNRLLSRAAEQRHVQLVQPAYILAWAMTEVAALLGLLDFFATGDRYYYLLFLIAVVGFLLHYPRREHVENAAFKGAF